MTYLSSNFQHHKQLLINADPIDNVSKIMEINIKIFKLIF